MYIDGLKPAPKISGGDGFSAPKHWDSGHRFSGHDAEKLGLVAAWCWFLPHEDVSSCWHVDPACGEYPKVTHVQRVVSSCEYQHSHARSEHSCMLWAQPLLFLTLCWACYPPPSLIPAWCCLLLSRVIQFFEILEKWLISCSWGWYFIHGKTQDFPIHWIIQLPGFMSPSWLDCWSPGAQWLRGTLVQPVRVYQGALCEDTSMVAP